MENIKKNRKKVLTKGDGRDIIYKLSRTVRQTNEKESLDLGNKISKFSETKTSTKNLKKPVDKHETV